MKPPAPAEKFPNEKNQSLPRRTFGRGPTATDRVSIPLPCFPMTAKWPPDFAKTATRGEFPWPGWSRLQKQSTSPPIEHHPPNRGNRNSRKKTAKSTNVQQGKASRNENPGLGAWSWTFGGNLRQQPHQQSAGGRKFPGCERLHGPLVRSGVNHSHDLGVSRWPGSVGKDHGAPGPGEGTSREQKRDSCDDQSAPGRGQRKSRHNKVGT